MTAAHLPLLIEQGATFEHPLTIEDEQGQAVNLTGYTARMDIRPCPGSATLLHSLSTANGGILIDGPAGEITLLIPSEITATFTWDRAEYDLLLTDSGGHDDRLIEGPATVKPGVTL